MLSEHELRAAQATNRLFGSAALRMPDAVRGLVDALFLTEKYASTTVVSPSKFDNIAQFKELGDNLVVVGGGTKNRIRRMYIDDGSIKLQMSDETLDAADTQRAPRENWAVEVLDGPAQGNLIRASASELIVIERMRDPDRGTTVFFCLGRKGDTSWAAAEYLARHWRELQKEFGQRNFAICLSLQDPEYTYEFRNPTRLWTSSSTGTP
jgi:hypothetical protein